MNDAFEKQVEEIAQHLSYPPIPSHPTTRLQSQNSHWVRWVAILVLAMSFGAFMIPDIQAAVLNLLQIGVVTIYLEGENSIGDPLNLNDVSGEVGLAVAQSMVEFTIRIHPNDLPDRVFVQDNDMVIFVWLSDNQIRQALYQTSYGRWDIIKSANAITPTRVGSSEAFWVDVQHPVQFIKDGQIHTELTHFVDGNVLVWVESGVTYRLETRLELDSARLFAESLLAMQ